MRMIELTKKKKKQIKLIVNKNNKIKVSETDEMHTCRRGSLYAKERLVRKHI